MRLETTRGPHPLHGVLGDARLLGHRPATPMRLTVRSGIPCQIQDVIDLRLRNGWLSAATRPHLAELGDTVLDKPRTPRLHSCRAHGDLLPDPSIGHAFCGQ